MPVIILVKSTYGNEARNKTQFPVYHLGAFVQGVCVEDVAFVCLEEGIKEGNRLPGDMFKPLPYLCRLSVLSIPRPLTA